MALRAKESKTAARSAITCFLCENDLRVFAARSRRKNSVGRTRDAVEVFLWRFHPGRPLGGRVSVTWSAWRKERCGDITG